MEIGGTRHAGRWPLVALGGVAGCGRVDDTAARSDVGVVLCSCPRGVDWNRRATSLVCLRMVKAVMPLVVHDVLLPVQIYTAGWPQ